ncbi:hypothetical protein Kpho02_31910 [Kitasatospora phosalacinea]|uniref:Uncharacterized protein n=1 Tax=Kitasatospora phosalacinea TaxID=2065 RepID=A0A9W6V346_9ACTN|nr:hypothetical protein [Kitasatospora phosalacinea]GLW70892.1 hypothetical protein Kpho02_31910 [Kitasatospora phosalacinea]
MNPLLLPYVRRTPVLPAAAPDFVTPLGPLAFTAELDGVPLPARPDRSWRLPSGALVVRWDGRGVELELLVTAYEPEPVGFARTAAGACGALWCLRTRREVRRPVFTAALTGPPPGTSADYNGSQGVASLEVAGGGFELALSGDDAEAICERADGDPDVPARWAAHREAMYRRSVHWGEHYLYERCALRWTLPELLPGEHVLLPASAAWLPVDPEADPDAEGDGAAWWGALTHPDAILAAAAAGVPEPPAARRRNGTRRAGRIGPPGPPGLTD